MTPLSTEPPASPHKPPFHPLRKFRVQLMVRFLVIVTVLAVMISIIFFQSMSYQQLEKQTRLLDQQALSYIKLLTTRIDTVESAALSMLSNSTIKEYLTYPYIKPAYQIKDALYSFQPLVRWMMTTNPQYKRVHFLTESEYTAGDTFVSSLTEYADTTWVQSTIASPTRGFWQNLHAPETFPYVLPMNEAVITYSLYNSSGKHMVVLDTDAAWLYQDLPFVVDTATGRILYSELMPEAVGQTVSYTQEKQASAVIIQNTRYFVSTLDEDTLHVTILACAEQEPIISGIYGQTKMFVLWTVIFILGALVLLSITSSSVVKRMSLISRNVSQITRGSYDISYQMTSHDEIDALGADIVSMSRQMNQMINQRLNQQMLLREAEFRALQQQINPHFIFNILQTMQVIAEMDDQPDLADMIAKFGRMVRYNLYATSTVPLRDELDNVRDYLMLQKVMYSDELEMDIRIVSVPDTLEMPRLLLQPLVENAVVHGRIPGQLLHVSILGEATAAGIRFSIRNDGKLLSPEREDQLKQVLGEVQHNPGSVDGGNAKDNLALINIQKRLMICYGSRCQLNICNDQESGVLVEFTIPSKEVAP